MTMNPPTIGRRYEAPLMFLPTLCRRWVSSENAALAPAKSTEATIVQPTIAGVSAKTFGASKGMTIMHVVLPAAAPYIFTGMRVSLAVSLILIVIAEMVAGNTGIGYQILLAQRSFLVADMYAGIILLGAIGYTLNRLFLLVEAKVLNWHQTAAKN